VIGPPGVGRFVAAAETVGGSNGGHRCRPAGLDVAQIVADIDALARIETGQARAVQQRLRVRLGKRRGVAPDRADRACFQTQPGDDRPHVTLDLVADDAPADTGVVECVEHGIHALEQAGMDHHRLLVASQELLAQSREFGTVVGNAEASQDQSACPHRGIGPQAFVGQRSQSAFGSHCLDGFGEVAGSVGQRAIEIEEDGLHFRRACAQRRRS